MHRNAGRLNERRGIVIQVLGYVEEGFVKPRVPDTHVLGERPRFSISRVALEQVGPEAGLAMATPEALPT